MKPDRVHETLGRHILADGYDMVLDVDRSRGRRLWDARRGRGVLDMFSFFATAPVGLNHPKMADPVFREKLLRAALANPTNSDIYTLEFAEFVETFGRVGIPPYLPYAFFVAGGALGVENALKAAMDWKVRRNFRKGLTAEKGHQIVHFKDAFHGRSGYTMSLTNTADPRKYLYFSKFDWPRITNPALRFPVDAREIERVEALERQAVDEIKRAFVDRADDIAAILIEPIQAEGGDHHFRPEFMRALRQLADENDALLIFDEVQSGVGLTGRFWAHQHTGVRARSPGLRQEDAGVRHAGRPADRRGARERLQGVEPPELDLGRQPGRHGPQPALPGDHRRGRPRAERGDGRARTCCPGCRPCRRGSPTPSRTPAAGA